MMTGIETEEEGRRAGGEEERRGGEEGRRGEGEKGRRGEEVPGRMMLSSQCFGTGPLIVDVVLL